MSHERSENLSYHQQSAPVRVRFGGALAAALAQAPARLRTAVGSS